jgi:2-alkenal reductase
VKTLAEAARRYPRPVHRLALVSLASALLGAAAVVLVGRAAGWIGPAGQTVVRTAVVPEAQAPVVVARPLTGNSFDPAQIYRARVAGVVTIVSAFGDPASPAASVGQGSGFAVSADGVVRTSAHVITTAAAGGSTRARTVYVEFRDGDRVAASIVGADLYDDVGVLRVDPRLHPVVPVPLGDSSALVVGQPVAAIGSPFGNADSLSVGVVSAVRRAIPSLTTRYDLIDAIQTDAPINHGNSGGPLFDARGRVIGINAQIRSSGTSSGFEGVGFAVPIDSARRSLDELLRSGKVEYAYLGISAATLTPGAAVAAGYSVHSGAIVESVLPGSPAAAAGLRSGSGSKLVAGLEVRLGADVVVAIDGRAVETSEDLVREVAERLVPGEVAHFSVVRAGNRISVPVRLGRRAGGNG